jgi:UDP-N-acetyl-D-galactosamine dehydrogenase
MYEYGLTCHPELVEGQKFDTIVLGVAHKEFVSLDLDALQKENSVLYDVKGILGNKVDGKL